MGVMGILTENKLLYPNVIVLNQISYMKKTLPIANGIALVATIIINYLSNTGVFNGNTMKTISDKYFNFFTPAGYAFSIWGLIYLSLLCFAFYSGRGLFRKEGEEDVLSKIGWWFVLSCLANSLWVVTWLHDYPGISLVVMSIILISLLKIIINTRIHLERYSLKKYLLLYFPFGLYAGWISVAFIANAAAYLSSVSWAGWGISQVNWTIIMLCVAGLVNIFMITRRNLIEYGLVGIWAVLAISASNNSNPIGTPIVYTCYLVAVILLLSIVFNYFSSKRNG